MKQANAGYTLVELIVAITIVSLLALATLGLMTTLLHGSIVAQRQAVAETLANNQMEYLKSLPYDNLAVSGGPIISTSYIAPTFTKKVEGYSYTVTTNINYVDDAYDGCGSYPTLALEKQYCRNYPPPSNAPNPGDTDDYKDTRVTVTDKTGSTLATLDTEIASLVSQTANNTGALFINVIDDSGNPISGASVNVINNNVNPHVSVSDVTDSNGYAIFYNLPSSTTGYNYQISSSKNGYSSLTTIQPSGSLQPTYSSQNLIAQNSSYVTLTLKLQGPNSLVVETTDTSGNPLPSAKAYIKGGYKKYTSTTDTQYYYDNLSPSDTRPLTDANGLAAITNLVPGDYIFCGDNGATNCTVNGTTYYLAAAVPYGGVNPLLPIIVPDYDPSNPPAITFSYNGQNYLQKVRLMLTTNANFPRVSSLSPYDVSLSGGTLSSFAFTLNGTNLPCSASASSCSTKVSFSQSGNTYTASCTGSNVGTSLNCTVNLTGVVAGNTQMIVTVGSNSLTLPASPLIGGLIVTP